MKWIWYEFEVEKRGSYQYTIHVTNLCSLLSPSPNLPLREIPVTVE
jgi:hypothetical protein